MYFSRTLFTFSRTLHCFYGVRILSSPNPRYYVKLLLNLQPQAIF